MFELLEKIFNDMGVEFFRQGSYGDEDYPNSFFTYWNADTPEGGFYDNEAHKCIYYWYVYFYTNNPTELYTVLDDFIERAKKEGFIVNGRGKDAPVDDKAFLGRYVEVKYIKDYNNL